MSSCLPVCLSDVCLCEERERERENRGGIQALAGRQLPTRDIGEMDSALELFTTCKQNTQRLQVLHAHTLHVLVKKPAHEYTQSKHA